MAQYVSALLLLDKQRLISLLFEQNQHASGSQSASLPINAGPQGDSQPRPSTQYEPSRNLGGHSSSWILPPEQQRASYYQQPMPPQYRPSTTEQFQQYREAFQSQNTAGAFRYAHPHPPNVRPTPAVPLQPYGTVFAQPSAVYGYPQQSMSETQTSSTQPFPSYNPPRSGQQNEGQVNNSPRHTVGFTSTSMSGSSFGQANTVCLFHFQPCKCLKFASTFRDLFQHRQT